MNANDFMNHYFTAYGESWDETFRDFIGHPLCAKHMAEFIDDIEIYGQQNPVYIDRQNMVINGHRIVLALGIMNRDVDFVRAPAPTPLDNQLWDVEFEILHGATEDFFNHLGDILSFRFEDEWIEPLDAMLFESEVCCTLHVKAGEHAADRLAPTITDRLRRLGGVSVTGMRISLAEAVDEDASE